MSVQLEMFGEPILEVIPSVTFSPVSEAGRTPCGLQAGRRTGRSGPAAARASRSASRVMASAPATLGTCGLSSPDLSPSAALQRSLASKLRERLGLGGSPEYALTWKDVAMPSGPQICAQRASAHPTSGAGCIGWRSPQASDGEGGVMEIRPGCAGHYKLRDEVMQASWPTPTAQDAASAGGAGALQRGTRGHSLVTAARLAGWVTPACRDWRDTPGMSTTGLNPDGSPRTRLDQLPRQAALGIDALPSSAPTVNRGEYRLNPSFSRWLMGYPAGWDSCGASAMQSSPKSRRRSLKPVTERLNPSA